MNLILVSRFRGCRVGILALAITGMAGASHSMAAEVELAQESEVQQPRESAAEEEPSPTPHPLSVPPLDHATYPADRPEWVDATPDLEAEEVVWPVKSLPCNTPEQAAESLRVQVGGAVAAYAEHLLGDERSSRLGDSHLLKISLEEIPAEDTYVGTAMLGDHKVYEHAVRLRFTEPYRQRLATAWQQEEVAHRLSFLGVAGGTGLCLLLTGTALVRRFARPTV